MIIMVSFLNIVMLDVKVSMVNIINVIKSIKNEMDTDRER